MNTKTKEKIFNEINGHHQERANVKNIPLQTRKFMDFLAQKYGFRDITYVTTHFYNSFFLAMDNKNRMLFIKHGGTAELYRNEYEMGMALWKIDHKHFLKPLYYCDNGEFFFFANEIMNGDSLYRYAESGRLQAMPTNAKMSLVRDLYQIFIDLKKSDVVHRDIRPKNLAILDNRLILIDIQLAVSKTHYVELESMSARKLRNLGGRGYQYRVYQWDDSYSLLKCLKFIGCPAPEYRAEYNKIYHEIKSYIGHDTIKSSKCESGLHRLWRHLIKIYKKIKTH